MADQNSEKPSYEEAREQLIAAVAELESGGTSLEETIALWEKAERLARVCQEWLDGARERLDTVVAQSQGSAHGAGDE